MRVKLSVAKTKTVCDVLSISSISSSGKFPKSR